MMGTTESHVLMKKNPQNFKSLLFCSDHHDENQKCRLILNENLKKKIRVKISQNKPNQSFVCLSSITDPIDSQAEN